jgi:hypothetical protein
MTAFQSRTVYAEWLVSAFESRGVAATEIASVLGVDTELGGGKMRGPMAGMNPSEYRYR